MQSAINRIATAKKYAALSPVNNCSELLTQLNAVPARLNQAHYEYLEFTVNLLQEYKNYNKAEYNKLAIDISNGLEAYKKEAPSVYGQAHNISILKNKSDKYHHEAMEWYQDQFLKGKITGQRGYVKW